MVRGDASKTPFLFNGMYGVMTDGNGLLYMRARFYNPEIRRFVNRDVLLGGIADGQTLNRFAFVTGRPVSFVDPFGFSSYSFDCFANCVEEERLNMWFTLGNLSETLIVGFMPKTKKEYGHKITSKNGKKINRNTNQMSRWAGRIDRVMKKFGIRGLMGHGGKMRLVREFGRSLTGGILAVQATGTLIFEGFYDIGAISRCMVICNLDSCEY